MKRKPTTGGSFLGLVAFLMNVAAGMAQPPEIPTIVSGAVYTGDGKIPLAGAVVMLWRLEPDPQVPRRLAGRVVTTDQGAYRFARVVTGEYELSVEAQGYTAPSQRIEVVEGQPIRMDFPLTPLPSISGRLLQPEGTPVVQRPVIVSLRGESSVWAPIWQREETTTDAEGRYRLYTARRGPHRVSVTVEDMGYAVSEPFPLDGQDVRDLDLKLVPGLRLTGMVTDEAGAPIPEAWVYVSAGSDTVFPQERWAVAPDPAGRWALSSLAPGHYDLTVVAPDFVTARLNMEVPGEGQELLLKMIRGETILGRVLAEDGGTPLPGARIQLDRRPEQATDAEGRFICHTVAPGQHQLSLSAPGFAPCEEIVQVAKGQGPLELTLLLRNRGGAGEWPDPPRRFRRAAAGSHGDPPQAR